MTDRNTRDPLSPWFDAAQAQTSQPSEAFMARLMEDMAASAPHASVARVSAPTGRGWIDWIADLISRPFPALGGLSVAAGAGVMIGLSDGTLGLMMLDSLGGLGAAVGIDLLPLDPDEAVYSLMTGL